ncbi:MAG: hypothetical protein V4509_04560 [Patescibacteria group bacterium]
MDKRTTPKHFHIHSQKTVARKKERSTSCPSGYSFFVGNNPNGKSWLFDLFKKLNDKK